jgi:replicative DNA helicase
MADIVLPHNSEAEKAVLGALLTDKDAAAVCLATLKEDRFFEQKNQLIFRAATEVTAHGTAIDVTTITAQLKNMKLFDDAGGTDYLFELVQSNISPDNIDHYVKIVKDMSVLREFLLKNKEIQDKYAQGGIEDVGAFLEVSVHELDEIASHRTVGEFKPAGEVAETVRQQIIMSSNNANKGLIGVDTGYKRLNKFTHGWRKGDFIVIAARPSVGKTAFAINLAYNAAIRTNRPVAFFSCEMSADQIMGRMISANAMVNSEHIQTGSLIGPEQAKVASSVEDLKKLNLYFDDTANPLLGDLIAKARKLKAAHPDLCLIVIDYLNLITTEGKYDSRVQEVSLITRSLKELARSLELPVIALAQLNRAVEDNADQIPMLSNLKESGSIEQDADIVLMMHRKDYYDSIGAKGKENTNKESSYVQAANQQVKAAKASGKDKNGISVVNFQVAKNRNGQTGQFILMFSKNVSRFDDPKIEFEQQVATEEGYTLQADDESAA